MPYEGNQRKGMEGLEEIGACVLFLRFSIGGEFDCVD
jgi:hypothetical protein